jgi:hypothetical protein
MPQLADDGATRSAKLTRGHNEVIDRNPFPAARRHKQSVVIYERVAEIYGRAQGAHLGDATVYWLATHEHQAAGRPGRSAEQGDPDAMSESESAPEDVEVEVGEQLGVVSPERMGWFRFYFDDQRWEWSEQVQRLHGYQPGTVTPTTDLVLSHKHSDDRDQVATTIDNITHTRGALSSRHRIIDAGGEVHWVVVIGDQFFDDDGAVIGTHGFYVDVTPAEREREDMITARVSEIADNRGPIEQAKGMLMLIYDVDDGVAFGLLKWLSQENNLKLRVLAEQVCTDLRATAAGAIVDKTAFDHALMTASQRRAG